MTTMHIPTHRKVAHVTSINTGPASPLISLNFQSTLDTPHCLREGDVLEMTSRTVDTHGLPWGNDHVKLHECNRVR